MSLCYIPDPTERGFESDKQQVDHDTIGDEKYHAKVDDQLTEGVKNESSNESPEGDAGRPRI